MTWFLSLWPCSQRNLCILCKSFLYARNEELTAYIFNQEAQGLNFTLLLTNFFQWVCEISSTFCLVWLIVFALMLWTLLTVSLSLSSLQHYTLIMSKKGRILQELEVPTEVSIIRIPPHHYIHVLDQNTNIARVEIGPLTYIRQDNERSGAKFNFLWVSLRGRENRIEIMAAGKTHRLNPPSFMLTSLILRYQE